MSCSEIHKKYRIPRSTIQYIVTNDLTTNKKRGQKVKLTKGDNRRIQTYVKQSYEKNVKSSLTDIIKDMQIMSRNQRFAEV